MTSQANKGEDHDRLVTSPNSIGENSTDEGSDIDKEAVESPDSKSLLYAFAKCTSDTISTIGQWDGTID